MHWFNVLAYRDSANIDVADSDPNQRQEQFRNTVGNANAERTEGIAQMTILQVTKKGEGEESNRLHLRRVSLRLPKSTKRRLSSPGCTSVRKYVEKFDQGIGPDGELAYLTM